MFESKMNLVSTADVKSILATHGMHPKKRLGQNFLVDRNVLNRLVDAAGVEPGSRVLEIGPGLGVVTRELAERGAKVVCVEADRDMEAVLAEQTAGAGDVEVVIQDFLKVDLPSFLSERAEGPWTVVGNLPYYITSPILAALIDAKQTWKRAIVTMQREVADRLRAEPGTKEYGSLTVFVRYHCEISSVMRVSKNVFYPVPDVDSEIIALDVRDQPPFEVLDEKTFFKVVRSSFAMRRKTLLNTLGNSVDLGWGKDRASEVLSAAGVSAERRGETLGIDEFARIANAAHSVSST
jgi:16S rRNA (adenine1518-N6/adenine1519-N6)-dimethyltransferase